MLPHWGNTMPTPCGRMQEETFHQKLSMSSAGMWQLHGSYIVSGMLHIFVGIVAGAVILQQCAYRKAA
jgi:hypothetical protein